jgi:hypothetical protein
VYDLGIEIASSWGARTEDGESSDSSPDFGGAPGTRFNLGFGFLGDAIGM